jgi:hypothetical protein
MNRALRLNIYFGFFRVGDDVIPWFRLTNPVRLVKPSGKTSIIFHKNTGEGGIRKLVNTA